MHRQKCQHHLECHCHPEYLHRSSILGFQLQPGTYGFITECFHGNISRLDSQAETLSAGEGEEFRQKNVLFLWCSPLLMCYISEMLSPGSSLQPSTFNQCCDINSLFFSKRLCLFIYFVLFICSGRGVGGSGGSSCHLYNSSSHWRPDNLV